MGDPAPRLNAAGKVAIPPLRPHTDSVATASASTKAKRTIKACAECKSKKIKCSGKKPTCDYCQMCQIPCIYPDGKRERNKKAVERGDRLLELLREATSLTMLPPHIMQELRVLESEVADDCQSLTSTINTTGTIQKRPHSSHTSPEDNKRLRRDHLDQEREGADALAAEVGSQESVDLAAEDFNRSERAKAIGFIGKHSEVAWAHRLARLQAEGAEKSPASLSHGAAGMGQEAIAGRLAASKSRHAPENHWDDSITDHSYSLDENKTLKLNYVEADELPPAELANLLVECYMNNVHDFFPMLIKPEFLSQFHSCVRSGNASKAPPKWRAILNLVFAIGAKFSHLVSAPWRGDERDHLLYHTRALQLSPLNEDTVIMPDLQRIQMMGLTAFYYLTVGHVSRSWIMLGLACRQAEALGLHLRNLAPALNPASREKRARVWWALYYLEYLLCQITGRPTMISSQFCSVQPLAPLEETALTDQSGNKRLEGWYAFQTESSQDDETRRFISDLEAAPSPINHFRSRVELAVITQKIFSNLYSAATISKTWQRAQAEIVALSQEVDQWYGSLPREFQFSLETGPLDGDGQHRHTRERVILGFCYYSVKMLLNRPCLCRVDERIADQAPASKDLDLERARECVMAARSISDLLPDHNSDSGNRDGAGGTAAAPDLNWLYTNGPWWCIVHYFMQAITILMLELALEEFHARADGGEGPTVTRPGYGRSGGYITHIAGKLVRWLSTMAATGNQAAVAACRQVRVQFEGFEPFHDLDTSGLHRDMRFGPEVVRRSGDLRMVLNDEPGPERRQERWRQHEQQASDESRMQHVSSEGVVYGAPPYPMAQQDAAQTLAHFGAGVIDPAILPEPQFTFGEPWDVSEEMVDWNNIYFDNPYDIWNPFVQANQSAEGHFWAGGGVGAGFGGGFDVGMGQGQGQGEGGMPRGWGEDPSLEGRPE